MQDRNCSNKFKNRYKWMKKVNDDGEDMSYIWHEMFSFLYNSYYLKFKYI